MSALKVKKPPNYQSGECVDGPAKYDSQILTALILPPRKRLAKEELGKKLQRPLPMEHPGDR